MATLDIYKTEIEFDSDLKYGYLQPIQPVPAGDSLYQFLKKAGFTPPRYEFIEIPATDFRDVALRLPKERFLNRAKRFIDLNTRWLEDLSDDSNIHDECRIACKNANGLVQRIISALQSNET